LSIYILHLTIIFEILKYDNMRNPLFVFIVLIISGYLFSCNKDANYTGRRAENGITGTITGNPDPAVYKVRQSIKIHDDNVNGVFLRQMIRIQEAVYYFYNDNDLLDSLAVYSDTSKSATLKRTMKLHYLPAENKIIASLYDIQQGYFEMFITYDNNKKVLAISNPNYPKEKGIFYIYEGEKLVHKKYDFGTVAIATKMNYDPYYNLTDYELYPQAEKSIKVNLEYDYNSPVNSDFDIRFNSKEITFIYEGGVNILSFMGLNTGLGNAHFIKKRTETRIEDTSSVRNQYLFEYQKDKYGRLINRRIIINDESDIVFEYNY